jgi:hypothetical protein
MAPVSTAQIQQAAAEIHSEALASNSGQAGPESAPADGQAHQFGGLISAGIGSAGIGSAIASFALEVGEAGVQAMIAVVLKKLGVKITP